MNMVSLLIPHGRCVLYRHYHSFTLSYSTGIEPWNFVQKLGDAVLIPAGCPYQVRDVKVNKL